MNLSTAQKVILGIFTILPLALLPFIFFQFFQLLIHAMENSVDHDQSEEFLKLMMQFIAPTIILSMLALALLIFFIIHVAKNNSLNSGERLIWIVIFFVGGLIGFPVYWYLRIWSPPSSAPNPLQNV